MPQHSDAPTTGRFSWLIYGSLILLGLLAFWPTVWFDFVNWDDPAYVWHNDLIKSWSPSTLYGVITETVTRNYAPLTIGTLLVDHTMWGMQPGGYHATNVLLHLINGVLVFLLTRQLTKNAATAWLTAALFLVHPVQIETVAWISSRKGLLSASFMLGALIVRLRPDADAKHDLWYAGLLGAALLSKALAVVIPPIVLLYDVIVLRRKMSDAFVRQVIPGLLALLLLLKTMSSQNSIMGGLRGHFELNLLEILAIDTVIMWKYVGMLIWPSDLCVLYDPPIRGISSAIAMAIGGWLLVLGGLWKFRQRYRMLVWAAATWLLLLLPVLNFFRITTLMNDRYLYLPCILFFAVAAAGFHYLFDSLNAAGDRLLRSFIHLTRLTVSLAMIVAALTATIQHLPVWRNSFTLWEHAMQEVGHLPVVRMQLALTHRDTGQTREAVRILQKALLECRPDELDRKRMVKAVNEWQKDMSLRTAVVAPAHQTRSTATK